MFRGAPGPARREHLHVDEAGTEHVAPAVDDAGAFGRVAAQVPAEIGDHPVLDEEPARLVPAAGRVDEPRVEERRCFLRCCFVPAHGEAAQRLGSCRAMASSTAMRTATPISTWSRMTLREWSAMVEAISTPRFIGPGCMISASGLARASFS